MVNVVDATLSPGVTLAGMKDAAQPLGSPDAENVIAESKEPYCGVTVIP